MTGVVSCGSLLLNRRRQLFVCRATGTARWDLPKGLADDGESPRAAAVREAWEESGLRLPPARLTDLGEFAYLPRKRLHLFALRVADDGIDPRLCRCRSFYAHHRTGRPTPEADAYAWKPIADVTAWCGKNMARVLSGLAWESIEGLEEVAEIEVDVSEAP